ncbi:MAG: hypothetical protein LKE41_06260 [Prevotella sp.]|jgi:hypothetical protein|nr:hypothetical protein [Prevotella sp.]MCI2079399.1 carbohydrate-binding family 9-like protein [Prevotella sp.]MCI2101170.1 carbohydrate-binding family 9-like protein [Prevotella sp.]
MKLLVKKLSVPAVPADRIPALFQAEGVQYHSVDHVNWREEYPYCPVMTFGIAHTDDAILIHYRVEEDCIRAVAPHDNGHVWEDSCCELFLSPAEDGSYYNMECNCAGTLLVGYGVDRNGRELAPQEVLGHVDRWTSLGRSPFESREGHCQWEMALVIPYATFFKHDIKTMDGVVARGNVYKCGDQTAQPHFLSWNPIDLPKPDFHCPAFFGEMAFE